MHAKDVEVEETAGVIHISVPDYDKGTKTTIYVVDAPIAPTITATFTATFTKPPVQTETVLVGVKFGIPDDTSPHEIVHCREYPYVYEADAALNLTIGDRVRVPVQFSSTEQVAVVADLSPRRPSSALRRVIGRVSHRL